MNRCTAFAAAAAMAALLPLHAQTRETAPLYKVELNVRDGADRNAASDRRYTLLVNDSQKGIIKVGSKSPVATGSTTAGNAPVTQFTYLDVGVNIECTVHAVGDRALMHGSLDLSSIATESTPPIGGVRNPTIRQTKVDLDTSVELGKPTVVASIDDPLSARTLQVEATITKAN